MKCIINIRNVIVVIANCTRFLDLISKVIHVNSLEEMNKMCKALKLRKAINKYIMACKILIGDMQDYNFVLKLTEETYHEIKLGTQLIEQLTIALQNVERDIEIAKNTPESERKNLKFSLDDLEYIKSMFKLDLDPSSIFVFPIEAVYKPSHEFNLDCIAKICIPKLYRAIYSIKLRRDEILKICPDFKFEAINLSKSEIKNFYELCSKIHNGDIHTKDILDGNFADDGTYVGTIRGTTGKYSQACWDLHRELDIKAHSINFPIMTEAEVDFCMAIFENPEQNIDFPYSKKAYFYPDLEEKWNYTLTDEQKQRAEHANLRKDLMYVMGGKKKYTYFEREELCLN